jgi:hypothetical protein
MDECSSMYLVPKIMKEKKKNIILFKGICGGEVKNYTTSNLACNGRKEIKK